MRARRTWFPLLFFCLLPVLPLWRAIFQGRSIGPFDQIRQMAPWHGPVASQPWDVLQADGVLQFYPWRDLVFQSWSHLKPPYWNPYELAGTPLLANSQSGGFYPLHILCGLAHLPTSAAIILLAWFHLSWSGLGVYMVSKRLGGSTTTAMIGGGTFLLSPFMLSWTALPSVITTVSWIPWGLFFVFESNSRRQSWSVFGLGVCTAMMILAGHLQFAAYGLLGIGICAIGRAASSKDATRPRFITLGWVGISLILGFLLAAPQLAPVLAFSRSSNRVNKPSQEGYSSYVSSAIQPFELSTLSNALALGDPRERVDENIPTVSSYWPKIVKSGANFAESAINIGPLLLGLLAFVHWKDRRVVPLTVLALIAFLLCAGTVLNKVLYFGAPGWSATGSPGRACVLFVLALSILAGSIDLSIATRSRPRIVISGALIVLGLLTSLYGPALSPSAPQRLEKLLAALQATASFSSLVAMGTGTLCGIIGIVLLTHLPAKKFRPLAGLVPILLGVVSGGLSLVSTGTPLPPVVGPEGGERVAYINRDWEIIQNAKANVPPNIASLNHIHELGGYDSLLNRDTVDLLNSINGQDSAPPANGNMMFIKTQNLAGLRNAGVSFIGTAEGLSRLPSPLGRVSLSEGTASIELENLGQLWIYASGSGVLTLRDRNMPGWEATVDGKVTPIETGIWRTIRISTSGDHRIVFSYTPPGLGLGIELLSLGVVLSAGLVFIGWRQKPGNRSQNV